MPALEARWFEATVGADVEGAAVDLPRRWAAIATGKRWVALDDGSLAEITSELAELLADARDVVDAHGHGRLPVHQVGRLDRWLDAPAAVVEISPPRRCGAMGASRIKREVAGRRGARSDSEHGHDGDPMQTEK